MTHNLSVQRGDKTILRNITLHIVPGQIVALLGRNGAGKSTLLKAISGEFYASLQSRNIQLDGRISLNGASLTTLTPNVLAQARAVLPQSVQFAFPFTAMDIVLLGRYPHSANGNSAADRKIAIGALALAGAAMLTERDVTTLSGGELARVQFARVLAQLHPQENAPTPRYLLLDEPTAALDLAHQHRMLSTLQRLAKAWNIGVMVIMHDPNLASRYADQLAWLADGRLLAQAAPSVTMTPALFEACLGIEVDIVQSPGKPPFAMPCSLP